MFSGPAGVTCTASSTSLKSWSPLVRSMSSKPSTRRWKSWRAVPAGHPFLVEQDGVLAQVAGIVGLEGVERLERIVDLAAAVLVDARGAGGAAGVETAGEPEVPPAVPAVGHDEEAHADGLVAGADMELDGTRLAGRCDLEGRLVVLGGVGECSSLLTSAGDLGLPGS